MIPFSKSVTPAVHGHLEAQTAFINDISKSLFESFQNLTKLNMQLAQTMMEESSHAAQHMLTADQPTEAISAAASHAQPAAEKLRAYQQHLSRLAAESQVEMARITEEHVPKTSSTAKKLAEDVARTATEETQHSMDKQQEAMRNFSDPFKSHGHDHYTAHAGASLQSASEGNLQRGINQPATPAKPK